MMPSFALFLILLTAGERVSAWDNAWNKPLNVVCPSGSAVNNIESAHSNRHEDRVWKIGCGKVASRYLSTEVEFSHCNWTSYVNDFDQPLDFQCPPNYLMAGMSSYHSNKHEDRRWKYFCCTAPGLTLSMCAKASANDWDGYLDIGRWVREDAYVTGAASVHLNHYEDRRWTFTYCKVCRNMRTMQLGNCSAPQRSPFQRRP